MNKKLRTLVVISVPFWRVAKVVLSNRFITTLQDDKIDIVFISPLDLNNILKSFNVDVSQLLSIRWKPVFSKLLFRLYNISEVMRMNGYWFKFRKSSMRYYYRNMYVDFSHDGKDVKKNLVSRIIIFTLSFIGSIQRLWRLFDILLTRQYRFSEELEKLRKEYIDTVLIQSSTWGEQDRVLASWARKNKIRSYFIPYTTDQLIMNGYLLTNYDKIFVQGSIEYQYAVDFHKVPINSIYKAGSMWFRNIDSLLTTSSISKSVKPVQKILYAGVLSNYYPRKNELYVVENIFLKLNAYLDNFQFIYRPYISKEEEKEQIIKALEKCKGIEIQWPENSINQISDEYTVIDFWDMIRKEVERIADIRMFIMSISTSMCIDAAYISNCSVVSNIIDRDGVLKNRFTQDSFIHNNTLIYVPGAQVASSLEELESIIKNELMQKKVNVNDTAKQIVSAWDYNNKDFPACLKKIILNNDLYE